MQQIKQNVAAETESLIRSAFSCDTLTQNDILPIIEYPPDPAMGELSIPCFKFSKALRRSPVQIAETLASGFTCEGISKAEAVSGYLNLRIDGKYLVESSVSKILNADGVYGSCDDGKGRTVVLDYSSPNVAKPFHIGHLGTTVIGHALRNLFEISGYKCVSVNHLGDWGTQFGKMIVAYDRWREKDIDESNVDDLVALYVRFHAEAEKDPSLEDEARKEFTKLEHGDPKDIELWKKFVDISLKEYEVTYKQLGIRFDSYTGESFYYDKVPDVVKRLQESGLLVKDEGASIVRLDEYDMPPCMILKSDGSSIYAARDIAAVIYRKKTYDFCKCVYVTSAGQSLHFAQFFKVLELMGYKEAKDELVHVPYGTVSINGEKLATRTGNVILLRDLFAQAIDKVKQIMADKKETLEDFEATAEAVGVGAIVFYYLSNGRMKDINFNLDDALSFEGNTGPYTQYTYARCMSLLEKLGEPDPRTGVTHEISSPEFDLALKLSMFPEKVRLALKEYEPSVVARYIIDLCASFNYFYHECPIASAEPDVRATRMNLVKATSNVLRTALGLICIKTPNKI